MKFIKLTVINLAVLSVFLVSCDETTPTMETEIVTNAEEEIFDRSQRPIAGLAPDATFPDYDSVELPNGLTLYIIESDRQPTVAYRLMLRSGGLYDGDKPGVSEIMASMLDKGVSGKSAFELASEVDFLGASLSAEASSDFIAISVSGLSQYKKELLDILGRVVKMPTFPGDELEKLKQRLVSGLVNERQDPEAMADKLRRKLVYGEKGYGAHMSEESIAAIERADLEAFHDRHFKANNASLAIVGDVDSAAIKALVEEHLGDWKSGGIPDLAALEFPKIDGVSIHIVDRPDSVQSAIRVAQSSVHRSHPDVVELRVIMSILGGGSNGRMYANLREDKGYTYGAYSYAANAGKWGSIVTTASVRNDVTVDSVTEMIAELERIRSEPIPLEELERHEQFLSGNYLLSLERPMMTATRVQEIEIYDLEPDYYKRYADRLVGLDAERAMQLASELLESQNIVVAVVGDASSIKDDLAQLGTVTVYNDRLEAVE